jgi:hypothetical protein
MQSFMRPIQTTAALFTLIGAGCAGATGDQLTSRAAFDLNCPRDQISVIEIDDQTRGVRGCGQQNTYVESCNGVKSGIGTQCTWVLNSDSTEKKTDSAKKKKKKESDE